jgi:hypothetical protein
VTQPDRFEELRRELQSAARIGAPSPQCLDADTIAALVDGTLEAGRREAALVHLAGCDNCQTAVSSVARALLDPAVARELGAADAHGRRRVLRVLLPVAAAAALLLILARPWADVVAPPHRGPPSAASTPAPIAPVGPVNRASPLQWTAVSGADRYRVMLSNAAGRVLYEAEGTDTVAALPDSVVLKPGRSYVWIVEARTGFDRWTASQLVEFSLAGAPPR